MKSLENNPSCSVEQLTLLLDKMDFSSHGKYQDIFHRFQLLVEQCGPDFPWADVSVGAVIDYIIATDQPLGPIDKEQLLVNPNLSA